MCLETVAVSRAYYKQSKWYGDKSTVTAGDQHFPLNSAWKEEVTCIARRSQSRSRVTTIQDLKCSPWNIQKSIISEIKVFPPSFWWLYCTLIEEIRVPLGQSWQRTTLAQIPCSQSAAFTVTSSAPQPLEALSWNSEMFHSFLS